MRKQLKPGTWVTWKTPHPDKRHTATEYGIIGLYKRGFQGREEYFIYWFSARGKVKYGDAGFMRSSVKACAAPVFAKDWLLLSDVFENMPLSFMLGTPCVLLSLKDRSNQVYIGDMKVTKKYVTEFTSALI